MVLTAIRLSVTPKSSATCMPGCKSASLTCSLLTMIRASFATGNSTPKLPSRTLMIDLFRVDGPDDVEVNLFAGGHDFRNSGSVRTQLRRDPHAGFQIAELLFLAIEDNLCIRGNGQTIERNHL